MNGCLGNSNTSSYCIRLIIGSRSFPQFSRNIIPLFVFQYEMDIISQFEGGCDMSMNSWFKTLESINILQPPSNSI